MEQITDLKEINSHMVRHIRQYCGMYCIVFEDDRYLVLEGDTDLDGNPGVIIGHDLSLYHKHSFGIITGEEYQKCLDSMDRSSKIIEEAKDRKLYAILKKRFEPDV